MFSLARDLQSQITVVPAAPHTALTAGGAGDNTAINGVAIDQLAYPMPEALTFIVSATAVLGVNQKLTTAMKIQDSNDGASWADVILPVGASINAANTFVLSATTAGTYQAAHVIGAPFEYLRRYVRLVATPDLDRAATDTASVQAVAILSGLAKL